MYNKHIGLKNISQNIWSDINVLFTVTGFVSAQYKIITLFIGLLILLIPSPSSSSSSLSYSYASPVHNHHQKHYTHNKHHHHHIMHHFLFYQGVRLKDFNTLILLILFNTFNIFNTLIS